MKRLIIAAAAVFILSATSSNAQTFTLSSVSNCGGTHTNGISFNLAAGDHTIEWVSGAYSLWSHNGENGGLTWIGWARAYVHATGDLLTFGAPASPTFYANQALAQAAAVGFHTLTIPATGLVTFYLSDGGGCGDNRGSVTLQFAEPVSTEVTTWGSIKALFQ